jgi:hypothetical protein
MSAIRHAAARKTKLDLVWYLRNNEATLLLFFIALLSVPWQSATGLSLPNVCRQRDSFSMIDSTSVLFRVCLVIVGLMTGMPNSGRYEPLCRGLKICYSRPLPKR